MGTSLTTAHRLIKPDDNESINVDHLNDNWETLDKAVPLFNVQGVPSNKTPKVWMGKITTTSGAGGEARGAELATNAEGVGGLWFGYLGLPQFDGISSVILQPLSTGLVFDHWPNVVGASTTRIKYRSRRENGFANGFGEISFFVMVAGW